MFGLKIDFLIEIKILQVNFFSIKWRYFNCYKRIKVSGISLCTLIRQFTSRLLTMRNSFLSEGEKGLYNQCTMADDENVYYRGEGICNLVLATAKVKII